MFSREEYELLEAVQDRLVVHPLTAPILGNDHNEYRSRENPVRTVGSRKSFPICTSMLTCAWTQVLCIKYVMLFIFCIYFSCYLFPFCLWSLLRGYTMNVLLFLLVLKVIGLTKKLVDASIQI